MTYEEALDYINSRRRFAKSSGHERIKALLEKLSEPQNSLRFVHVVGTNGKGSVSTMISSVLTSAGYRTGLFTSPFVIEFRERIRVDGEFIEKQALVRIIEKIKSISDELEKNGLAPTFFEVVLALALTYFREKECDIVVLEAGIGGRDDSTNIIPAPLAAVIMSVSLDHVDVLGDTVEKIAEHKCGIIKTGCDVVSYPDNGEEFGFLPQKKSVVEIIKRVSNEKGCPLFIPDMNEVRLISQSLDSMTMKIGSLEFSTRLSGVHQIANSATAVCAVKRLSEKGFDISDKNIVAGMENAFIPARMEVVSKSPLIILDGGHNEGCIDALCSVIKSQLANRKITALMSFMKDKAHKKSVEMIAPLCENMVFTLADSNRGEKPSVLKAEAEPYCKNVFSTDDVSAAFEKAKSLCKDDDVLIAAGSFYLVSDIRKALFEK